VASDQRECVFHLAMPKTDPKFTLLFYIIGFANTMILVYRNNQLNAKAEEVVKAAQANAEEKSTKSEAMAKQNMNAQGFRRLLLPSVRVSDMIKEELNHNVTFFFMHQKTM